MFRLANAPKFNSVTLDAATATPTFCSPSFRFSFGSQNATNLSTNAFNPNDSGVPKIVAEQPTSTAAPVFGGLSFADLAKNTNTVSSNSGSNNANEQFSASTGGNLSFAALAQNNSNANVPPVFDRPAGSNEIIDLSAHVTFRNLSRPQNSNVVNGTSNDNNTSADDAGNNENAAKDDSHDPHYDPIIALPDEIQVNEIKKWRTCQIFCVIDLFISIILNHKAC